MSSSSASNDILLASEQITEHTDNTPKHQIVQKLKVGQNQVIQQVQQVSDAKPAQHQPFWYGGVASMVAATCTHPLDLAKVRMQTAGKAAKAAAASAGADAALAAPKKLGMVGTIASVMKNEGVLKIYQGLSASLLRQATYSTARFGVYEFLKEQVKQKQTQKDKPLSTMVLLPLSMVAGLIGGVVGNPADVVNVRMQNDRTAPVDQRRNYRNALDGIRRMIIEEGPKSIFKGIVPNCTRGVLMTASQVVSYDRFKDMLVNGLGMNGTAKSTHFGASLLAGLVATTVCSPVDVVKTRIMSAAKSDANSSAVRIFVDAVKSEGPTFMFRGWLPSFVRLGPHTIITFLVLEQLKHYGIGQH